MPQLRRALARRLAHDLFLVRLLGIIDPDFEHKAVQLRFGQRIRAFLLDRILRGQNKKRQRQLVARAAGRHGVFLHRFEQRGLGLGRSAVDFVRQQQIGENRAFDKLESAAAAGRVLLQDVRAQNIRRHQVGRELHALELHRANIGQRAHHQRLGQAWRADHDAMAAAKHRRQHLLHHGLLADDDLVHFLEQDSHPFADFFQMFRFDCGFRHAGRPFQRIAARRHSSRKSGKTAPLCQRAKPAMSMQSGNVRLSAKQKCSSPRTIWERNARGSWFGFAEQLSLAWEKARASPRFGRTGGGASLYCSPHAPPARRDLPCGL
ncbi:MAG: hypothetical protein BWZ10_01990 [candidate division BRC1 bacterium ADurb.BinA364]|nr:MAG: hypothetical protein BWZ10_01990 [candidate division BRC1 bacterium ADurb.BinA364]